LAALLIIETIFMFDIGDARGQVRAIARGSLLRK